MDGIVTVLNTPFTASDAIDTDGLQRNVAQALDAGVSGFLLGGLAGEVAYLTEHERVRILEATREVVNGQVPVIGGAYGESQAERIRMAGLLIDHGCDGLMASTPYEDAKSFERQIRELAALKPGVLMIQDWDPGGTGIPIHVITDLFASIPEFGWLKIEVVPAGPKYTEVLEKTNGSLKVAGGWAVREMIDALDRGVHAFMPTAMHAIYTTIYTLYKGGRQDDAADLFDRLQPVLNVSNQSLETSIHFFKRLQHAQGTYETDRCRVPFELPHPVVWGEIDAMVELAITIETSLDSSS